MNDLVVRDTLHTSLQAGSLASLVKQHQGQQSTMLLLDHSYSMTDPVAPGSRTRSIDALRTMVTQLKEEMPSLPLVAFGGARAWVVNRVGEPAGGTPLAEALDFARLHHALRVIIISDGIPNSEEGALRAAREFNGPIDVFYVGPRPSRGEDFLKRLALASGGQFQSTTLAQPKQLAAGIRGLLAA